MGKKGITRKYRVTPHFNVSQYLFLPQFNIEIGKNDHDVWECHIQGFNLYAHSADPDYDSAFPKIQDRVKGLVLTHIIEALDKGRDKAIYGLNSSQAQNNAIDKLRRSYDVLISDKMQINNFIHQLSITPLNFSEKELKEFLNIVKTVQSKLEKLKENIRADVGDLKKILLEVLSNFNIYHFRPKSP